MNVLVWFILASMAVVVTSAAANPRLRRSTRVAIFCMAILVLLVGSLWLSGSSSIPGW